MSDARPIKVFIRNLSGEYLACHGEEWRFAAGREVAHVFDYHADDVPKQLEAAQRNLAQNGLAARSEVALGTLPVRAPAPLVVANLVAALQVELAPLLAAAVTPGGRLLISGIFTERAEETVRAFTQLGMRLAGRWEEGEWVALEWTHG